MNNKIISKFIRLFPGFFCIALGIFLMRLAYLGLNPWGTFHDGMASITGLKFGTVSQLTGLTIILISIFLKMYPGIGTILNMYFCGYFINMIERFDFIPVPESLIFRSVYYLIGIWTLAFGIYIYLSAGLGAGPRDGLMIGLVKKTKYSVTIIRTTIELTILIIGFLLGGTVGVGTIFAALLSGYSLQTIFKVFKFNPKEKKHLNLSEFFKTFNIKFK